MKIIACVLGLELDLGSYTKLVATEHLRH